MHADRNVINFAFSVLDEKMYKKSLNIILEMYYISEI